MDCVNSKCTFAGVGCFRKAVDYTGNSRRDGTVSFSGLCYRGSSFPVLDRQSHLSGCAVGRFYPGKDASRVVDKCERLWRDLLADPSQWWDNRIGKPNGRFPDFKHKETGEGLWVIDGKNPPWVASEIASIAPGVSIFSWAQRLSKYNKAGQFRQTLQLYEQMENEGKIIDGYIFVHVLNACAALKLLKAGKRIHQQIIETGCDLNVYVGNSLVDMYGKCGSLDDAWRVFDQMVRRDVFGWNAIIWGFVKCGQGLQAMELFQQMQQEDVEPNSVTFLGLVNACASMADLEEGRRIHQQIIRSGCEFDLYVGSSLVDMYAKCGSIDDAWRVFVNMPTRNVVGWNVMIVGCVKFGQGSKVLELYQQMQREGVEPDSVTFVGLMNACASIADLEEGRRIHKQIAGHACECDVHVNCSLVDMYAKCGSTDEAWRVFQQMPTHDVVGWNAMILGFAKCGQGLKALELFQEMQQEGVEPNSVTFVGLVNACASIADLEEGKRIHELIVGSGFECHVYVGSGLVDMYAKCGSIDAAWKVFCKMPTRNFVAWNAMIIGFVKCDQALKALELFQQMQQEGVEPSSVTFVALVNACASVADLKEGRRIHQQIIESGCECDAYVRNSLVDMYAKCESIDEACKVLKQMPTFDVVGWNAMIMGFVKCRQQQKALELFSKMQQQGVEPDSFTFVGLVNACASIPDLEEGVRVHKQIVQRGLESDVYVCSSLVDMYNKCGDIDEAWRVFKKVSTRNVVGWNAMIMGFLKCGQGSKALEVFQQMQQEGVEPNSFSFVGLLNACAIVGDLTQGMQIHDQIARSGFEFDAYVPNSLVDMYAKCGSIENAWRVFERMPTRDVVSWNTMITGLVKCEQPLKALDLFQEMQQHAVEPDSFTFVGLVNACAAIEDLGKGRQIHEQIIQSRCESDLHVGSSLVDMYAKCRSIDDAWTVFGKMPTSDVVGWTAMIMGLVKCRQGLKAIELFKQMQDNGIRPNTVTYISVLNACASEAALETGKCIHRQLIEDSCEFDVFLTSSLLDMYCKCGSLDVAEGLFETMPTRTAASWNTMIMGYGMHGRSKEALALFGQMLQAEAEIDEVTFICLLSACSHGGLLKEGMHYFDTMKSVYNICPRQEHYTCMVDLLGRAGLLDDAEEMVKTMPVKPSAAAWMALLGGCRIHGNVEIGERASKQILQLDPYNASGYVLLSNIYAAAGKWDGKTMMHEQRQKLGMPKEPECTWVHMD